MHISLNPKLASLLSTLLDGRFTQADPKLILKTVGGAERKRGEEREKRKETAASERQGNTFELCLITTCAFQQERIDHFSPTVRVHSIFIRRNYRCQLPRPGRIYRAATVMHLNVARSIASVGGALSSPGPGTNPGRAREDFLFPWELSRSDV